MATATDETGKYLFDNLIPGPYTVEFVTSTLPDGFRLTATDSGLDTTDINGYYLFTDLTDLTDGTYRVRIAVESTTSAS